MAKTKAEIRAFLNGQVGKIAPHPGYPSLNGQCVTLTKALMEFLDIPNPYAARGNAIDAGDTYIRQGLGTPGKGWLTIVVNRDMGFIDGVHYGHIWIDLSGEANYEANGARALYTTKNTRPISQGQQFVNFDKHVKADTPTPPKEEKEMVTLQGLQVLYKFYLGQGVSEYGMKHRLGKQTFNEAQAGILESEAMTAKVKKVAETQAGLIEHLPQRIQEVVKLPEQVK